VTVRAAHATILAAWSAFFAYLWLSEEANRYLGQRSLWIIPVGACVTGLAAAAQLRRRSARRVRLERRQAPGMLVMLVPIVIALATPHAELGAAAAEQRTANPDTAARLLSGKPASDGVSYAHIMAAASGPQPGVTVGTRVRLVGFVMRRPGTTPPLFQVARFYITCCVADATVVYATVSTDTPAPPRSTWIDVTGTLARQDGELVVRATRIDRIEQPAKPYLSASGTTEALAPAGDGTRPPKPAPRAKPRPAPPPVPARRVYARNSTTRHAVALTVTRVEFSGTETRVFATITNNSSTELKVFANPSQFGSTRAVSGRLSYAPVANHQRYPLLPDYLDPGARASGVITFPPIEGVAPLRVVVSALSADAALGKHGMIELPLAWSADGDPSR
jgi:uncharacterized repeat protein (TIGR03943 family)